MKTSIDFYGAAELKEVMDLLGKDFGPADQKKILVSAVKKGMAPVLSAARFRVPVETGGLRASLRIEARKPTRKDRRSKYISETDAVIATVTTAPGNVLAKKQFYNLKTKDKQKGIPSDARAVAMEFGTANVAAQPYLRPALEGSASTVLSLLSDHLKTAIDAYRARQAKKGRR